MTTQTTLRQPTASSSSPSSDYFLPARKIWLRLALFLAPILALTVLPVTLVDPYNVLGMSLGLVSQHTKWEYGEGLNSVLWKLPQYDRNPKSNILLGDSQMEHLRAEDIAKVTGNNNYFNLAYGGGTLRESISSFWHAASLTRLKSVYFEISFMDYNANPMNRVVGTEKIIHHSLQYFENPDALQASYYDLLASVFHRQIKLEPQMSKEVFWRYQLAYLAGRYHDIPYPSALRVQLQQIAAYCRANNIRLYFVITPQSVDAQRRVAELGVTADYLRFKSDLESIAPTIDCDIPSAITTNRDNYSDPFHLLNTAGARIVADIWTDKFQYCRKLGQW